MGRGVLGVLAAGALFASGPAHADEQIGAWTYKEVVDPLTDQKRPVAGVYMGDEARLAVKCDKVGHGEFYVSFASAKFLGDGRATGRPVSYRFDSGPPMESYAWRYGDTVALALDQDALAFADQMQRAKKVFIRVITYRHEQVDATFDLTGADVVVPRVIQGCAG